MPGLLFQLCGSTKIGVIISDFYTDSVGNLLIAISFNSHASTFNSTAAIVDLVCLLC